MHSSSLSSLWDQKTVSCSLVEAGSSHTHNRSLWIVCVPFRDWMGNTKYLNRLRIGARCTGLCQELQRCWVFHTTVSPPCVSRMVHNPKDIQPTWQNCGKHWSQHGPASLWNAFDTLSCPCPDELRLFWGHIIFLSGPNCVFCLTLPSNTSRDQRGTESHAQESLMFQKWGHNSL